MRRPLFAPLALLLLAAVAAPVQAQDVQIDESSLSGFEPLPEVMEADHNPVTSEKVKLGRMLYYDTRFSKNQKISCNTCHDLDAYGIDTRDQNGVSVGHIGLTGNRNSPTVYNAAGQIAQFWDGRSPNVEHQAQQPVLNPVEMAMPSEDYVLEVLNSIPGYERHFERAFPDAEDPITFENFGKAIGAFERKLTTPAPWDEFLEGDKDALTDEQKEGFQTFQSVGCITCHNGPYLGGNAYRKVGLIVPWPNQEDKGRYEVTGNESDKFFFKVPSLRNVTETAPYFHDGSIDSLDEAIRAMAKHQLGRYEDGPSSALTDEQVESIKAFFTALKGEIPEDYIEKPELPESGPDTPEPDPSPTETSE